MATQTSGGSKWNRGDFGFSSPEIGRDPARSDVAPDGFDVLPGRRSSRPERPRSEAELAHHGYYGQGYPVYGEGIEAEAASRDPARFGVWSGAFGHGYTTSLHTTEPREGERRAGGHAGKGPRDYVRADSRIYEDVCERLSDDDSLDASDISVRVSGGEVFLEGNVPDRYSKRCAERLAFEVRGVVDVHNALRAQKGLLRDLTDEVRGAREQHQGHHGEGPRA